VKLTYIYYILLVACFINSLFFLRSKIVRVLAILLLLSIATEVCAEVDIHRKINYYVFYHVFTIAEYSLITVILSLCIKLRKLRIIMFLSIPVFTVCCTLIMQYLEDVKKLPSISGGIEGTLLIIWCLRAFYELEVDDKTAIFQKATFWFILAFYSYYVIVTPFNCVFNILQEDPVYQPLSTKSFAIINSVANYLLYILCMIGLSCLKRTKYIQQSS